MKFIKKFIVAIIGIIFIAFLFIYRQYNINKANELKNSYPQESTAKKDVICLDEYQPVCGADGKTYSNECVATKINEVEIKSQGACKEEIKIDDSALTGTGIGENNLGETEEGSGEEVKPEETASGIVEEKLEEAKPAVTPVIEEKHNADYYKNLRSQCDNAECCLASVDNMENGGYGVATDGACQSGYSINSLKCEESYKWCSKDAAATSPASGSGASASGTVNGQKVLNYSNSNYNYGFSLPAHTYFSGYGASDGANHSVGISSNSGATSLGDSQVKVYYYKNKILPELKSATNGKYTDPSSGKIYLELNGNTVVIESSVGSEKIVNMIENTIYAK